MPPPLPLTGTWQATLWVLSKVRCQSADQSPNNYADLNVMMRRHPGRPETQGWESLEEGCPHEVLDRALRARRDVRRGGQPTR